MVMKLRIIIANGHFRHYAVNLSSPNCPPEKAVRDIAEINVIL